MISSGNSYINLPAGVTVTPAGESSYTWTTPPSTATQALEVLPAERPASPRPGIRPRASQSMSTSPTARHTSSSSMCSITTPRGGASRSTTHQRSDGGRAEHRERVQLFRRGLHELEDFGQHAHHVHQRGCRHAVLSGLFFDPPPPIATSTEVSSSLNASTYGAGRDIHRDR